PPPSPPRQPSAGARRRETPGGALFDAGARRPSKRWPGLSTTTATRTRRHHPRGRARSHPMAPSGTTLRGNASLTSPSRRLLKGDGRFVFAEDLAQHVADFADRRLGPHGLQEGRHDVVRPRGGRAHLVERRAVAGRVTPRAQGPQPRDLL